MISNENDEQLGIVAVREALRIAHERELDLVEIAPKKSAHDQPEGSEAAYQHRSARL